MEIFTTRRPGVGQSRENGEENQKTQQRDEPGGGGRMIAHRVGPDGLHEQRKKAEQESPFQNETAQQLPGGQFHFPSAATAPAETPRPSQREKRERPDPPTRCPAACRSTQNAAAAPARDTSSWAARFRRTASGRTAASPGSPARAGRQAQGRDSRTGRWDFWSSRSPKPAAAGLRLCRVFSARQTCGAWCPAALGSIRVRRHTIACRPVVSQNGKHAGPVNFVLADDGFRSAAVGLDVDAARAAGKFLQLRHGIGAAVAAIAGVELQNDFEVSCSRRKCPTAVSPSTG